MKKAILVLLCCAMLASTVSCNKNDGQPNKNIEKNEIHNSETINGPESTYYINTDTDTTSFNNTNDSPQLKSYRIFQESVNSNSYDKWLETTLTYDSLPITQAYGRYCVYWKNELSFTIEKAKILFEDENKYLAWKDDLYTWLQITQETYQNEINSMDVMMNRLEITIPYCKLIRQKVIDTKYFCYILECNVMNNNSTNPIGLEWANDLSIQ